MLGAPQPSSPALTRKVLAKLASTNHLVWCAPPALQEVIAELGQAAAPPAFQDLTQQLELLAALNVPLELTATRLNPDPASPVQPILTTTLRELVDANLVEKDTQQLKDQHPLTTVNRSMTPIAGFSTTMSD